MAYNETLAGRIRLAMGGLPGLVEKKMFGGVGFLLNGNMACGVMGDELIIRVGPDRYEAALSKPNTHTFSKTGRPMSGWITVSPPGYETELAFREWIRWGVDCASSLPAK